LESVCYGNGTFVAVGQNATAPSGGAYKVFVTYSPDLTNWTHTTYAANSGNDAEGLYSVCYGKGMFVAVGYYTKQGIADKYYALTAYSTNNGEGWTKKSLEEEVALQSVCYGNGRFVATVRNSSNKFAFSTDGITWKFSEVMYEKDGVSKAAIGDWRSICHGGDANASERVFRLFAALKEKYDVIIAYISELMSDNKAI
jgi:hypothetical protein